jgi:hypothetical protein
VIDEHAQAVIALLDADNAPPALNVHDGKVPAGVDPRAAPYVLVYFDSNDPESTKEAAPYRFEMTATCHSVGGSAQGARMVADRVRTALLAVTPTVAGRVCFPIVRESGQPPRRDETTGSAVFDQVDIYTLTSLPG